MKKFFLVIFFLLFIASPASAHMPQLIYSQQGDAQINNPEYSQAFYDELKGQPRNYLINSDREFNLYLNLLVPEIANPDGRYSANIILIKEKEEKILYTIDANSVKWEEFYEPFGRDYYLKGPELDKQLVAGKYKIEVFSKDNLGKYVLAAGKQEVFPLPESLNVFWQLPVLKMDFFKSSVLQFFFTPFGIAGVGAIFGVIIILAILNWLVAFIVEKIRNKTARTVLLTSAGMEMKDEIIKLLQKPAYDVTVAFINTAYKFKQQDDPDYANEDLQIMKEMGFNVEEIDIEDKKQNELMNLLEHKDIIFVAGGNISHLLKVIKKSGFEKTVKKLLKKGKVYIGAGEGSVVAGREGMKLVPFNLFVHYVPENAEIIKKKMPFKWQRRRLKILTDQQAILVQGRQRILIGQGEKIVV